MKADGFQTGLTVAQIERLAILAEECGEVVQVVGKILRHGYHSYNPTVPTMQQKPNVALLQKELGDLLWAISKLDDAADVDFQIPRTSASLNAWLRRKQNTAAPYLHHQPRVRTEVDERSRPAAPTVPQSQPVAPQDTDVVALAQQIADQLFFPDLGTEADRLVLTTASGKNLGAWYRGAVVDQIAGSLRRVLAAAGKELLGGQ